MAQNGITQADREIFSKIATLADDPLGFVQYVYPWGEPGTPLENHDGPDAWQAEVMEELGEHYRNGTTAKRIGVSSGHGIGKSCLISWIIHHFMSTRREPQIVVTANTLPQLSSKTWRELALWWQRSIHKKFFQHTATRFYAVESPSTWFAAAIPWNEQRSEAFAGTHAEHCLMLFDEASLIPDKIWEVAAGAMTTPGSIWVAFGNPTQNKGMFRELFPPDGRFHHRWSTKKIDARTAKMADKELIRQWLEDYGEDSDYFRVRVRGEFPVQASSQFFSNELIAEAMKRDYPRIKYQNSPIIICADVARYGDDDTVISIRQGLRVHDLRRFNGLNEMEVVTKVLDARAEYNNGTRIYIFADATGGYGAGVVDRLNELGHRCIGVQYQRKAADGRQYHNLRTEMYFKFRKWLESGGSLPDDNRLREELAGIEYTFNKKSGKLILVSKEDYRRERGYSPDASDSLAMGFAHPVLEYFEDDDNSIFSRRPLNRSLARSYGA